MTWARRADDVIAHAADWRRARLASALPLLLARALPQPLPCLSTHAQCTCISREAWERGAASRRSRTTRCFGSRPWRCVVVVVVASTNQMRCGRADGALSPDRNACSSRDKRQRVCVRVCVGRQQSIYMLSVGQVAMREWSSLEFGARGGVRVACCAPLSERAGYEWRCVVSRVACARGANVVLRARAPIARGCGGGAACCVGECGRVCLGTRVHSRSVQLQIEECVCCRGRRLFGAPVSFCVRERVV